MLCHLCSEAEGKFRCPHCGKLVCPNCRSGDYCLDCSQERLRNSKSHTEKKMHIASKVIACFWLLAALWAAFISLAHAFRVVQPLLSFFLRHPVTALHVFRYSLHTVQMCLWWLACVLLAVSGGVVAVAVLLGRIWGWWCLVTLSSLGVIGALVLILYTCCASSGGGDGMWKWNALGLGVIAGVPSLISLLALILSRPRNLASIR
jgi:hypothetical protein